MRTKRNRVRRTRGLVFGVGYEALEPRVVPAVVSTYFPFASELDPNSITTGPDNNLWFAVPLKSVGGMPGQIGSLNPTTGAMVFYTVPDDGTAQSIVSGPQGDLWFADDIYIFSLNPTTGAFKNYLMPFANAQINSLTVGSDGNLWFTDTANAAVGEFNTSTHVSTEFPLPQTTLTPLIITSGPGGSLWFSVESLSGGRTSYDIGDISPTTHAITLTPVPLSPNGGGYTVQTVTGGPGGNVWFNETYGNAFAIASINTTTRVINQYAGGGFGGITTGSDGNIWYSNGLGTIDVTTHESVSYQQSNYMFSGPTITSNPGGKLYIANANNIQAVTIVPASQAAIEGSVLNDPTGTGSPTSGLYGQTVYLDLNHDGHLDPGDPTASTDALGYYSFTGLTAGTYTVNIVPYPGNVLTNPASGGVSVTVAIGQTGTPANLGMISTSSLIPLSYNPTPFGTNNPDDQTAEVNGLYQLILGRAPDPSGGASAVSFLKNGGSLAQLAGSLITSTEYDTDAITSFYYAYLRRAPDPGGEASWLSYLQHGGTLDGVAEGMMDSAEYSAMFPSNASFTQAIYGDILGRLASSSEISTGANALAHGLTRSAFVASLVYSAETDQRGTVGLYGIILARPASSQEVANGQAALQGGLTFRQYAVDLLSSAEFINRANATVG